MKAEKDILDTSKTSVEPETSPAGKEILFKVGGVVSISVFSKRTSAVFTRKIDGAVGCSPPQT